MADTPNTTTPEHIVETQYLPVHLSAMMALRMGRKLIIDIATACICCAKTALNPNSLPINVVNVSIVVRYAKRS